MYAADMSAVQKTTPAPSRRKYVVKLSDWMSPWKEFVSMPM
jgi:hypothetical protein